MAKWVLTIDNGRVEEYTTYQEGVEALKAAFKAGAKKIELRRVLSPREEALQKIRTFLYTLPFRILYILRLKKPVMYSEEECFEEDFLVDNLSRGG
ncbi:MAG: hypothetical protein ABWK01_07870 [Infirmifilum sp.]